MQNDGWRVLLLEPLGDGGIAHNTFNLVRSLQACGREPLLYISGRYEFSAENFPAGSLRMSLFRLWAILGHNLEIQLNVVDNIPQETSGKYRFTKCLI